MRACLCRLRCPVSIHAGRSAVHLRCAAVQPHGPGGRLPPGCREPRRRLTDTERTTGGSFSVWCLRRLSVQRRHLYSLLPHIRLDVINPKGMNVVAWRGLEEGRSLVALRFSVMLLCVCLADRFLLWQRAADCRRGWRFLHGSPLGRSSDVYGHGKRRAGTSLRLRARPGTEDSVRREYGCVCVSCVRM